MKKRLILGTIVILGIGVGGWMLSHQDPLIPSDVFQRPSQWTITIPDSQKTTSLEKRVTYQNVTYLEGTFQQDDDQNTLLVNTTQSAENAPYWITTSVLSNSGSGQFYYLSLFQYKDHHMVNLDNVFLGDRIHPKSIQWSTASTGQLGFLTHNDNQPYYEAPTKKVNWSFSVVNGKIDLKKP